MNSFIHSLMSNCPFGPLQQNRRKNQAMPFELSRLVLQMIQDTIGSAFVNVKVIQLLSDTQYQTTHYQTYFNDVTQNVLFPCNN